MLRTLLLAIALLPPLLPAQTDGTVRRGLLVVECIPESAVVTIDAVVVGTTPFRDSIAAGHHTISLSSLGYQVRTDTVTVPALNVKRYGTRLRPLPGLTIFSVPSHVPVTVDSLAVGETPLIALPLAPGNHTVTMRLDEHRPRDFTVRIDSGDGVVRTVTMIPTFGFLSVNASPTGARIALDSAAESSAPLGPLKLPVGLHTLRLMHPDFPKPVEGTIDIGPGQHSLINNNFITRSHRALIISAFVPGLGQAIDGHWLEGTAELTAFTATVFAAKNAMHNVTVAEHDLSVAQSAYDAAPNENAAFLRRTNLLRTQSTLGSSRRSRALWISAAAALYTLILADAVIDHSFIHWLQIEEVRPVPVVNDRYQLGWTAATVKVPL